MSKRKEQPSYEEKTKTQVEQSAHQSNLGQTAQSFEAQKAKYLDRLAETGMSDAKIEMLDNMTDKTWVLGNLSNAEMQEIRWWLQTTYLKIKAEFPPQESDIQGTIRAYIYDDRDEEATALSGRQKIIIAQMLKGIAVYVSRSKQGFQQEQMVKQISVSEVRNPDEDNDRSILGGLRT